MTFDHTRLDVYRRALDVVRLSDVVALRLRADAKRQLRTSTTSIVANIAEGAGEFSPREKVRFYRMARRSAIEAAAWLDIAAIRVGEAPEIEQARAVLHEVVSMLVRLVQAIEGRASRG